MIHKVFALSQDKVENDRSYLSLFDELPRRRLEIRAGKFSMPDFFDLNSAGSDTHLQFVNWSVDNNGAWDYAADTRGYTVGVVADYEDRLYSDVQLAARRSLAAMALEEILTNRHRLSEEILRDVKEAAAGYGVNIARADVKDLVFPGNLQEIMNRVLAAERNSQAQLVEARTKSEVQRIEAQTRVEAKRHEAEADAHAQKLVAEAAAEAKRIQTQADVSTLRDRAQAAQAYSNHPALLRLEELATLRQLASSGNARLFIDFQKGSPLANDAV
jgi:regulator of protease activity HflC (stomatin/prohibitin superfamily)